MQPQWTQNDVTIDAVRLHYYRTGRGGKQPLVLVHGFSDNGLCWTPVARDLESEFDVVMPDMRGHGLSERIRPGEKVDMAADLAGLIRALGLNRSIVVGHSMGAMVAYQAGLRFPELARALVLEDPPWWLPRSVPNLRSEQMVNWVNSLPHQTLDELLSQYRKDHPAWPEELVLPMCESKKQLDPAVLDTMGERMHSTQWEWIDTVQNIHQPMLIITGDASLGGIVTDEVVAKVRELNPRVIIANVTGVGHLIRFDNPAAFMEILRRFLKQIA